MSTSRNCEEALTTKRRYNDSPSPRRIPSASAGSTPAGRRIEQRVIIASAFWRRGRIIA